MYKLLNAKSIFDFILLIVALCIFIVNIGRYTDEYLVALVKTIEGFVSDLDIPPK